MGPLAALIPILGPAIATVLEKIIPDKAKAQEAANEVAKAIQDLNAEVVRGQIEINKLEAQSPSILVSGWRPSIGWACSVGFWLAFVLGPLTYWLTQMAYWIINDYSGPIPILTLDTDSLMALGGSMLGLAGIRTWEKKSGVARN